MIFSNLVLNKILNNDDQMPTPEFHRYYEVNEEKVNGVARAVLPNDDDTDIEPNTGKQLQNEIVWKKLNRVHEEIQQSKGSEVNESEPKMEKDTRENTPSSTDGQLILSSNQINGRGQEDRNQFMQLKVQMLNIESLATQQIARLKKQVLEKEEQIGKLLGIIQTLKERDRSGEQERVMKEIGICTDDDYKDEEIKSLKEALIRHIRVNKQLTKKLGGGIQNLENGQISGSLSSSISKLVSNILI